MDKRRLFLPLLLAPFFIFIFKAYFNKIAAFGCFDDCFNFSAAYFMTRGKTLYSQIFFNHQPLMASLSFLLQSLTHPPTLYKLILYHRLFVICFSLLLDIFLILRFSWPGIGFVLFYETTKYYIFGDRFLAEGLIVYPLVYLFALVFYRLQKRAIFSGEIILSAVSVWFIIFCREPYIPVAIFLYVLLLWNKKFSRARIISFFVFILFSFFTLLSLPLSDYIFNVVDNNLQTVVRFEASANKMGWLGFLKGFFYPFHLFLGEKWNLFKIILDGLDAVFLILISYFLFRLKKIKQIMIILLVLGLSNIRVVPSGQMFYASFHMIPWYGLLIMTVFLLLREFRRFNKRLFYGLAVFIIGLFGFALFSPRAFFYEKVNKDTEFTVNYAQYFVNGEVVRILADPGDTLFVDGWDELISWQAKLDSPYQYSLYTSFMPYINKYTEARTKMFHNSPPDFYYGNCPKEAASSGILPDYRLKEYRQFYFAGKPTCLHLKKTKASTISKNRWEKVKKLEYYLPEN